MISRLLEEISWERATAYRAGGRGRENVLSAEVLIALDFLPRHHFLGALFRAASGADQLREQLAAEVEEAVLNFLPGDMALAPDADGGGAFFTQPDALLATPGVFLLVEAKRIRPSSFQPKQLAQELVAVIAHAGHRLPAILLLGVQPPILVRGGGRMGLREAIAAQLDVVLQESGMEQHNATRLLDSIDDIFCWISWSTVADVVRRQSASFVSSDPSVKAAVTRLAASINNAVAWHS